MTTDEEIFLGIYNEYVRKDREYLTNAMQLWRHNLRIIRGLQLAGLWSGSPHCIDTYCRYGYKQEVLAEDLPKLRAVFPQVKDTGAYDVHDAEAGTVRVMLDFGFGNQADSWLIKVYYVKSLPVESRCRIVPSVTIDHKVVCGVNP